MDWERIILLIVELHADGIDPAMRCPPFSQLYSHLPTLNWHSLPVLLLSPLFLSFSSLPFVFSLSPTPHTPYTHTGEGSFYSSLLHSVAKEMHIKILICIFAEGRAIVCTATLSHKVALETPAYLLCDCKEEQWAVLVNYCVWWFSYCDDLNENISCRFKYLNIWSSCDGEVWAS